jgi:hypothetical protein
MSAVRWLGPLAVLVLLGVAVSAPRWLPRFVKADGKSQRVWVREELDGYGWRPEKLDAGTLQHYEGCTLVNGTYSVPGGRGITAFAATWFTGKGADLVNGPHTPDVCYPAAGASRVASRPDRVQIPIAGQSFGFGRRIYRDGNGRLSLIYYTHLLGGTVPLEVGRHSWTRVKLALQLKADRRRDQLYLLVTTPLTGEADAETADATLQSFLSKWVTVDATGNPVPAPASPPVAVTGGG